MKRTRGRGDLERESPRGFACEVPASPRQSSRIEGNPMRKDGAAILIDALKEEGVEVMFGYPGAAVIPVFWLVFIVSRGLRCCASVGVCAAFGKPILALRHDILNVLNVQHEVTRYRFQRLQLLAAAFDRPGPRLISKRVIVAGVEFNLLNLIHCGSYRFIGGKVVIEQGLRPSSVVVDAWHNVHRWYCSPVVEPASRLTAPAPRPGHRNQSAPPSSITQMMPQTMHATVKALSSDGSTRSRSCIRFFIMSGVQVNYSNRSTAHPRTGRERSG